VDTGMFLQNIMLAAESEGLATCPQASLAEYPDTVRRLLGIEPMNGETGMTEEIIIKLDRFIQQSERNFALGAADFNAGHVAIFKQGNDSPGKTYTHFGKFRVEIKDYESSINVQFDQLQCLEAVTDDDVDTVAGRADGRIAGLADQIACAGEAINLQGNDVKLKIRPAADSFCFQGLKSKLQGSGLDRRQSAAGEDDPINLGEAMLAGLALD